MINYPDKAITNHIFCVICNSNIKNCSNLYQSKVNFGVICNSCMKKFSKDDLELISSIFMLYGGFFGKLDSSDFSIKKLINDLSQSFENTKMKITIENMNIKVLHNALLHGISPEELIDILKSYLSE